MNKIIEMRCTIISTVLIFDIRTESSAPVELQMQMIMTSLI